MQSLNVRELAQIRSQSGRGAAGFLSAVPSQPELPLPNQDMLISLRRWLRLPLVDNIPDGICCCSARQFPVTLTNDHLLRCKLHRVLTWRHDQLRRTVRHMALAASFIAEEEPGACQGSVRVEVTFLSRDIRKEWTLLLILPLLMNSATML